MSAFTDKDPSIKKAAINEIDFFKFHPGQNDTDEPDFGSPYFFAGINYMRMNPKGKLDGEWVELQPLGTEGQGTILRNDNNELVKKYSRNQIVIPFGVGVKMNITHHLSFGLEYGMRKTFTDYLDDVSGTYADNDLIQSERGDAAAFFADPSVRDTKFAEGVARGNSKKKDWYSHFNVYFTYNLIGKKDWR